MYFYNSYILIESRPVMKNRIERQINILADELKSLIMSKNE